MKQKALTITVLAEKGGCGKTTTVLEIASVLGERKKKVLVVDMDPQANTTLQLTKNANHSQGLFDVFDQERKVSLNEVLVKTDNPFVVVAPADRRLLKLSMTLENRVARDSVLKKALKDAYGFFDYIILDTPPALGINTVNALVASDYYLIVTDPSEYARISICQVEKLTAMVQESLNENLKSAGILVTAFQKGGSLGVREFVSLLETEYRGKFLKDLKIPHSTKMFEAQRKYTPITKAFPDNAASQAYRNLTDYIQNLTT